MGAAKSLRSVHGASPVALIVGDRPTQIGIANEPHDVRSDGDPRHLETRENRIMAAQAFYKASKKKQDVSFWLKVAKSTNL